MKLNWMQGYALISMSWTMEIILNRYTVGWSYIGVVTDCSTEYPYVLRTSDTL